MKENNHFGRCLLVCLFSAGLTVLPLHPRKSNSFSFLTQITLPAHYQSHRCLSPLKNSDITYIFYLWILQSTSCHYFFTFKCIIQSLQDKIISLAWPQSSPFSLQWTFLWIKQVFTSYFLTFLSLLPLHLTSSPTTVGILDLQGIHMSNSMTSFQRSGSSTWLDHSRKIWILKMHIM